MTFPALGTLPGTVIPAGIAHCIIEVCKPPNHIKVQGTNDSSIISKSSMCRAGYFKDDFVHYFISKPSRRAPIINRGYYIRAKAVDYCIKRFLCFVGNNTSQILCFGAGFDSTYFRLKSELNLSQVNYFEVDFPSVVCKKKSCILQVKQLLNLIDSPIESWDEKGPSVVIYSNGYKLLGVDLRYLNRLAETLTTCGISHDKPTLILTEVVLPYLDVNSSTELIKWSAETFPTAIFISYEQVCPNDAFGLFMQRHFKTLGTPLKSLSSYPDILHQKKRFVDLGWTCFQAVDMNDFFQTLINDGERNHIECLELFDEYEEWILKCGHYIIIAAWNGIVVDDYFLHNELDISLQTTLDVALQTLSIELFDCSLERHSHSSEKINPSLIITVGGFGKVRGHHGRGAGFTLLDLRLNKTYQLDVEDPDRCGERMHHSLSLLQNGQIFIFGGRFSPLKSFADIVCLSAIGLSENHTDNKYSAQSLQTKGTPPCSRWRHSATVVSIHDKEKILIFGGKTDSFLVLGDCYLLDVENLMWTKIEPQGSISPSPVCSHAAVLWNNYVIITCGLDQHFRPVNSIIALNLDSFIWEDWKISELIPRFSHTAHIYEDKLFLIGGVSAYSNFSPGVAVINLSLKTVINYSLLIQPDPENLMMFYNHSSVLMDNGQLFILGGGGNCFSFGTHLNSKTAKLDLNQVKS